MELWIRVSDSVANGVVTFLVVCGVGFGLLWYARMQGTPLFPRKKAVKP